MVRKKIAPVQKKESKADEPLTSLQRDDQSKVDKRKKYSRVETLHSLSYSVKEIAHDSQVNMSLSTVKRLKSKIKDMEVLWEKKNREGLKSYQRFIKTIS